jgi:hypothetical protein
MNNTIRTILSKIVGFVAILLFIFYIFVGIAGILGGKEGTLIYLAYAFGVALVGGVLSAALEPK